MFCTGFHPYAPKRCSRSRNSDQETISPPSALAWGEISARLPLVPVPDLFRWYPHKLPAPSGLVELSGASMLNIPWEARCRFRTRVVKEGATQNVRQYLPPTSRTPASEVLRGFDLPAARRLGRVCPPVSPRQGRMFMRTILVAAMIIGGAIPSHLIAQWRGGHGGAVARPGFGYGGI